MASSYRSHLGDLSPVVNFFAWWFLPGMVSGVVLRFFYRLLPSWRPENPSPTLRTSDQKLSYNATYELQKREFERRSRLHRSVAHSLVIALYLVYTLHNVYTAQASSNYYSVLGLTSNSLAFNSPLPGSPPLVAPVRKSPKKSSKAALPDALLGEAEFKSHWRKLARSFHPDKLNPPNSLTTEEEISLWRDEVQATFIGMREAYETLSDDGKHWAYDRFGPTVGTWKNCVTMREYFSEGLKHSAPFWVVTVISLCLIGGLRKVDPGSFWRWSCLMIVAVSELTIITSSTATPILRILSLIFPDRAAFQQIELLRQIFIASSSITTQLSSILYPQPIKEEDQFTELIEPILGSIEQAHGMTCLANFEVIKMVFNDLHPLIQSFEREDTHASNSKALDEGKWLFENQKDVEEVVERLKTSMLDTFCDLKLQADANGRTAWIEAIRQS